MVGDSEAAALRLGEPGSNSESFQGTERFEVRRRLGRGAFGSVYEVFDREFGAVVALKTLERTEPNALYLFKREFRELAEVSDPHLVSLYELLSAGDRWFFTMELVEGSDFRRWVRRELVDAEDAAPARAQDGGTGETVELGATRGSAVGLDAEGLDRLRAASLELATGIQALHRARKLHRDLKPSNVMVRPSGDVVLLDFGLVLPLRAGADASKENNVAGTPRYMAPEQAAGHGVSPAVDWYAFGVMLFEGLTGRTPFEGTDAQAVLQAKLRCIAPRPSSLVAGVPPDLDDLCADLLAMAPDARPGGRDVLGRLGGAALIEGQRAEAANEAPFVGRAAELHALRTAFDQTQAGRPSIALIQGLSGIGKSRLLERAVDEVLATEPTAVFLSGRCYQQESVPFKGLDSAVDALSRFLDMVPAAEASTYLPRDIYALTRLFPVLARVSVVADTPQRGVHAADDAELRRRASAALGEMLGRIAARRPLIMAIDDLQWAGEDTIALLADILGPPDPPAMMLVGTYRSEETASSAALAKLGRALDGLSNLSRCDLVLAPLSGADARKLANTIAGDGDVAERIASESEGSPFLVCELSRHFASKASASSSDAPRVGEVVIRRTERLEPVVRRLLEVVAIAGRPIDTYIAADVAECGADANRALSELRTSHLIRLRELDGRELVEAYHDRIRDGVARSVDGDGRAAVHRSLAESLEAQPDPNPEYVMQHWLSAGASEKAAPFAAKAAARAVDMLAFERAIELYRIALELASWSRDERRAMEAATAHALASVGLGTRAGLTFLRAAELADDDDERQRLRLRAAEQLLLSGRIDKGTDVLASALAPLGLSIPSSRTRALAGLLSVNARLRLRGMRYTSRRADEVSPALLRRIDACWMAGHGLTGVSPIASLSFIARAALLSQRAGEPSRVAITTAFYAGLMSAVSTKPIDRALEVAEEAATQADDIFAITILDAVRGAVAYFRGDLEDALKWCDRAALALTEECRDAHWEIQTVRYLGNFALSRMGRLAECGRRIEEQLERANRRGDLYAAATIELSSGYQRYLARDEPMRALEMIDRYVARWSQREMHYQHFYEALSRSRTLAYLGQPRRAFDFVNERWGALRRAGHLRVRVTQFLCLSLRAEHAISASYADPSSRRQLLAVAAGDIKRLARVAYRGAPSKARQLQACLSLAHAGPSQHTLDELAAANRELEADSLGPDWAMGERLLGRLLGGDEGAASFARGTAFLEAEGFVSVERLCLTRCPGPPDDTRALSWSQG